MGRQPVARRIVARRTVARGQVLAGQLLARSFACSNICSLGHLLERTIEIFLSENSPNPTKSSCQLHTVLIALSDNGMYLPNPYQILHKLWHAESFDHYIELLVIDSKSYKTLKERNDLLPTYTKSIETQRAMPVEYLKFPKHQPRTCVIHLNNSDTPLGFETVNPLTCAGIQGGP
ncbi:unnamed protein product [Rotaria magnacalcarata]|uniref:Uncharacterized protein n=1 Tax=Rotaria magnacalcarata TaxID=392030 RepID=A0A8S2QC87_9BILA|nr:unnamed protein product [Rotaria magnacalcarata]CAF4282074.1 unnamed protein product [Rotaria magnacalcarata]